MRSCPSCAVEIPAASEACPRCGNRVDDLETFQVVVTAPPPVPQPRSAVAPKERFAPGTLLASRYRIISRLGKGGMGEVFRADDLVLGQQVALKFLPESAKRDVGLLTRFYDEVRIARQISHKNVCRVYDIGEVDGQPYLSMEYIDGEDLGSLLRRIGRLPADKATEFARKLCAGVAAAHAQGVLHRDLKPANIMIDSRGELRITDFGLAGIAAQLQGAEIRSGTPAYMAPEQLLGTEVSVQSDLYAVGLVLFEMFTGKTAFAAGDSFAEMVEAKRAARVTNPSTLVGDLDKTVERAILRCLEADPRMRPASALALAGSLPGGDPLAAALAEGETPSPEMVAAAGSTDAIPLKIAVPALAAFAVALIAFCVMLPRLHTINMIPMENPPEVLAAKARDVVRSVGYTERPADSTQGFYIEIGAANYVVDKGHNMADWARLSALPPSGLGFWYRQSPQPLAPRDMRSYRQGRTDPPETLPGMITVNLDLDGRLRYFLAIPADHQIAKTGAAADWGPLLTAARLDSAQLKPAEPEWAPLATADTRVAWTGPYAGRSDLPVRVEAGSIGGRPVYFQVVFPWTKSTHAPLPSDGDGFGISAYYAVMFVAFIAALWVARYNWLAGRGDIRGATRVGIFGAATNLGEWVLAGHHVTLPAEQYLITAGLFNASFGFVEYWLFYMAIEPWVRRYWPQAMITWSRVLAGRWKDPLVGRDLLFGGLAGLIYMLAFVAYTYASFQIRGHPSFGEFAVHQLNGFRASASWISSELNDSVISALGFFLVLLPIRALLKKEWLVGVIWVVALTAVRMLPQSFSSMPQYLNLLIFFVFTRAVVLWVMTRYGFFAAAITLFVQISLDLGYLTTDFTAWFGQSSAVMVVLMVAMGLMGFRLATGSRPLLVLEEKR